MSVTTVTKNIFSNLKALPLFPCLCLPVVIEQTIFYKQYIWNHWIYTPKCSVYAWITFIKLHPKCLYLAFPSLSSYQEVPTCSKEDALPARKLFKPRAVTSAALVAETYATPSCCTLRADFALRLVKLTRALKDWLAHCQKTTAGVDLPGRRSKPTSTSFHY